jgi:hypothetical protein
LRLPKFAECIAIDLSSELSFFHPRKPRGDNNLGSL